MHVKVIPPGSLDLGGPTIQQVKFSSRGLLGSDRDAFVKRAAADILKDLDRLREKVAADEPLIHMLAIGATESFSSNRNGDGFRSAVCRQYHPTFVKHAYFYRSHQNKDPQKSYGRVIKSAFNEPMQRIELIVALNGTAAAARRNNGLVADREMEKLAAGKEIPVSMAALVSHDICSYCGNKAPSTKSYCTGTHQGGMCKAGGLRDNIGALVDIDGGIHHLHADNPDPKFFDISHVFRPADRIAYVTGMLEKAAAFEGKILKSAELARQMGVTVPYELMIDGTQPAHVQRLVKLAYQLADTESLIASGQSPVPVAWASAFSTALQDEEPLQLPPLCREKFALALRALSDQKVCLPFARFIELVTDQPTEKAAEIAAVASRELPGIYTRMISDGNFPERVKESQYAPSAAASPARFAAWAATLAPSMSLSRVYADRRVKCAALRLVTVRLQRPLDYEKTAADNDAAVKLAEEYALYQLSFLGAIDDNDPELGLTRRLAVIQNYAID